MSRSAIVCGLGYGDEGKGSITDFLVRERGAHTVVRYNGGPQAAHNVVAPDGRWHCFAQLGAGSFVDGVRTVLGPEMLVELEALAVEANVLAGKGVADPLARLVVDPACVLVTPMHKLVNQLGELAAARGSCGMGVGEAVRWRERGLALRMRDLATDDALAILERLAGAATTAAEALLGDAASPGADVASSAAAMRASSAAAMRASSAAAMPAAAMREIQQHFRDRCVPAALLARYRAIAEHLAIAPTVPVGPHGALLEIVPAVGPVVFEGAQGALLDRTRGFVPFVTQSCTTAEHALAIDPGAERIGVTRAYHHRHGRGPLVTEDVALGEHLADPRNPQNRWQGPFRVGHLDLVALRYGAALAGPLDRIALTCLDRLAGLPELRMCTGYEYAGELAALGALVDHEPLGPDRARIRAIRTPATIDDARRLADVLGRCRPLDWITLPGFATDVSDARTLAELPDPARRLVDVVERVLHVPVAIVSVGADATRKLVARG